ncbi:MAG: CrcB family protein [Deltaproteobacteria bacterium]|nr:CrcB family protein [Deltaproteobacteria bacterium]
MGAVLRDLISVAIGGALGASLRFAAGVSLAGWAGPWVSVLVNVIGSGLMGWLVARYPEPASAPRLLLGAGVLGGFTTFSAFSADAVALGPRAGSAYVLASVALALAAFHLGRLLGSSA